jgi:hypothetical protein
MNKIETENFRKFMRGRQVLLAAALLILVALSLNAQIREKDLAKYFSQNQLELKITNGRLDGAGGKWLREEAAKAQFIFVGEEHDTREVPLISSALWRDLVPAGYRHVAIEAGPWLGNRLDRFGRFKDEEALASYKAAALPRCPGLHVPPASVEDIAFFSVLAITPRPSSALVWGLDVETKVTPLLERLIELSAGRSARVRRLLERVSEAERRGEYDMLSFKPEIEDLVKRTAAPRNSETSYIRDALRWKALGKLGDHEREEMMKQTFLRNYRAAQATGEKKASGDVAVWFGSRQTWGTAGIWNLHHRKFRC